MNLDMGELKNRLRSRSNLNEANPEPDPPPEINTTPSPTAQPNLSFKMPPNMMGELKSQMERRNRTKTQQDEAEKSPNEAESQQMSSANLKMNPFLGELNSRLRNRRSPEEHSVDAPRLPPKLPAKPKISPKPSPKTPTESTARAPYFLNSPNPSTSPKPVLSPTVSPANYPGGEILSNKPVSPNTSSPVGDVLSSSDKQHSTSSSVSPTSEPPLTERKGTFLDELKRKMFSAPSNKGEQKDEEVQQESDNKDEKENMMPTLTHEFAKHRLHVRPKKTHRLSYAEFRKSRLIQEAQAVEEKKTVDQIAEVTSNEEELQSPTACADIPKGETVERQEEGDNVGSDIGSPLSSSADISDEQIFLTPPTSPSLCSDIVRKESTSEATSDFYSATSELPSPSEMDFICVDLDDLPACTCDDSAFGFIHEDITDLDETLVAEKRETSGKSECVACKRNSSLTESKSHESSEVFFEKETHSLENEERNSSAFQDEHSASERKTPAVEEEASGSERKSPVYEERYSASERNKPAFEEVPSKRKSPSVEEKSVSDRKSPAFEERCSASERNKPLFEEVPSASERNKPLFEEVPSASERKSPAVCEKSARERKPPTFEERCSASERNRPLFEEVPSASERKSPEVDEESSVSERKSSAVEEESSVSERKSPAFEQRCSTSERNKPLFEEVPSASERKSPSVDEKSSASERKCPAFEERYSTSERKLLYFQEESAAFKEKSSASERKSATFKDETASERKSPSVQKEQPSLDRKSKLFDGELSVSDRAHEKSPEVAACDSERNSFTAGSEFHTFQTKSSESGSVLRSAEAECESMDETYYSFQTASEPEPSTLHPGHSPASDFTTSDSCHNGSLAEVDVPPVPPCRKARAAKLKLRHEIEQFQKRKSEVSSETISEPSALPVLTSEYQAEVPDDICKTKSETDKIPFETDNRTSKSTEALQSTSKRDEPGNSEVRRNNCTEFSAKTDSIGSGTVNLTEDDEDFVLLEVPRE